MSLDMEIPPGGNPRGVHEVAGGHAQSTVTALDLLARASRHDYALQVVWERADRRVCTSLFTTLPAAERKVLRTRERGLYAQITLVKLVPVHALGEGVEA